MARKVDVVRPRALRDVVVPLRRPTRGNSAALGLAMLLAAVVVGFVLGFIAARLWGGQ